MPMRNKLKSEWVRAGYGKEMGSRRVVPPPPATHVPAYHLTAVEHAVSDIALGRLKVARFSEMNDRFELLAPSFKNKTTRRNAAEIKKEIDQTRGVLCFSANWTEPILWSHYGARHSGICLGFHLDRTLARWVDYKDERIHADIRKGSGADVQTLLVTKFKHWEYEQEIRVVVQLDGTMKEGNLYFRHFDDGLRLKEVILGPTCSLSLDAARKLVGRLYPQARTYKARLASNIFSVVPNQRTVDW